MLETAILGLLVDQDLHGYELKKRLTRLLGPWSSVSFGSLYPALGRLERNGLVRTTDTSGAAPTVSASLGAELAAFRSRGRPATGGRRGRKVYALTAAGRERLTDLLRDPAGDDRSFAIRVAFCGQLEPTDRLTLFQRRDAELARQQADRPGSLEAADRYRRSFDEYRHDRLARERAWLADLLAAELDGPAGAAHRTDPSPHLPGGSRP